MFCSIWMCDLFFFLIPAWLVCFLALDFSPALFALSPCPPSELDVTNGVGSPQVDKIISRDKSKITTNQKTACESQNQQRQQQQQQQQQRPLEPERHRQRQPQRQRRQRQRRRGRRRQRQQQNWQQYDNIKVAVSRIVMMQTVVLVAVITTQTINNSKCSNQSNKNELWCKASFQRCCVEVESKKGSNFFFRIDLFLLYMYRKNSHIWVTTQNFIIIRWKNESGYPCPHSYWLNPHLFPSIVVHNPI